MPEGKKPFSVLYLFLFLVLVALAFGPFPCPSRHTPRTDPVLPAATSQDGRYRLALTRAAQYSLGDQVVAVFRARLELPENVFVLSCGEPTARIGSGDSAWGCRRRSGAHSRPGRA